MRPDKRAGAIIAKRADDLLRFCESEPFSSPVSVVRLRELADLTGDRVINSATAKKLLGRLMKEDFSPTEAVEREGLAQICDRDALLLLAERAVGEMPKAVGDYRRGKAAARTALLGNDGTVKRTRRP